VEDHRRHPRIDFHLPVEITGHSGLHMIKNFSLGGLFVETEAASEFGTGHEIELVMKLPPENDIIRTRPRIARVTTNAIGVEFVDLAPSHAMALEWCFHVFRHTIPMPGA
jgi:hypothetical protein